MSMVWPQPIETHGWPLLFQVLKCKNVSIHDSPHPTAPPPADYKHYVNANN